MSSSKRARDVVASVSDDTGVAIVSRHARNRRPEGVCSTRMREMVTGPEPAEDLAGEHLAGGHAVPSRDHDGVRGAAVAAGPRDLTTAAGRSITPVDRPQRDAHLDGPSS